MTVILGGTSGLGREIAKVFQARGEQTFVVGRSYDETHGLGMRADFADPTDIERLVEYLHKMDDKLDLYWLTGVGYQGDFAVQQHPEKMAAVNFGNVLPVIQAIWQKMLTADTTSHLVVVSSTSGFKPRKDEAVYAATKHAQTGFTRSLGLEAERIDSHCKVALFMPGGMQTPFWEGNRPAAFDEFLDPKKVAAYIVDQVATQTKSFYEEVIERGSL